MKEQFLIKLESTHVQGFHMCLSFANPFHLEYGEKCEGEKSSLQSQSGMCSVGKKSRTDAKLLQQQLNLSGRHPGP